MLVVSRPTSMFATASFHTARPTAEEKRGFLSRLNPFAKLPTPEEPVEPTPGSAATDEAKDAQDLSVEIEEGEDKEPIPRYYATLTASSLSLDCRKEEKCLDQREYARLEVDTHSTIF